MKNEAPSGEVMTKSLALLLVWYAGLAGDPAAQRGEIAASRNALAAAVARALHLTPQQRVMGRRGAQRGREVLGDLARLQLMLHVILARSTFQSPLARSGGAREMARSLDRILAASFSVATELADILDPSQRSALDTIPLGPAETRWFVELTGMARGTRPWRSSEARTRTALEALALPADLADLVLRHLASPAPGPPPPSHDLRQALLWLSSDVPTASRRAGRCLEINLLTLLLLSPGFDRRREAAPTGDWRHRPKDPHNEKGTVT
jgi:hypothetical protein